MNTLSPAPVLQPVGGCKIHRLSPAPGANWETAVSEHPQAGVFHDARWLRVLKKTYGRKAFFLEAARPGRPSLLIPFVEVKSPLTGVRGVSLPFTDFCPPLGADDGGLGSALDALLAFGRERGWQHFELRGTTAPRPGLAPSGTYLAHRATLQDNSSSVPAAIASSARRSLQKAEREGVQVTFRTDEAAMQIYRGLHDLTRLRHGVPPQPARFFRHLQAELLARQGGFVAVASLQSRPIAAAIFLLRGANAVYKFGASDLAYKSVRANSAVMAGSLRELFARGVREVHFGRTSADNEGLRQFKRSWGGQEEPLHYFRICVRTGQSLPAPDRASGWHTAVFRRLPRALNRLAGQILYPHLD